MSHSFNPNFPTIEDLKRKAKKRIPQFAFDYLEEGCNNDIAVAKNRQAINSVELTCDYLQSFDKTDLSTTLFGHTYSAPFGIAPVGLQGLMYPQTPEILARAAYKNNIPFVLSTVSSAKLEDIADITEGQAWYQFYNPTSDEIRLDLLNRVKRASYKVLVITVDVPTFGFRPRDIRNGLSMPPKMSLKNIIQMLQCPAWLFDTARAGKPEMQILKPYMPKNMPTSELAAFMNDTVMGKVDWESLKVIRDLWQGPLVIKGVISETDVEHAIKIGADAVVVSNHGGRQLDAGLAPVKPLQNIAKKYSGQIKIFMDSGLESGPHIANALACGAEMTFLGRAFVYGVAALGKEGGDHTINLLKTSLTQVMGQLRCSVPSELQQRLVKR